MDENDDDVLGQVVLDSVGLHHLNWRQEAKKIHAVCLLNQRTLNRRMDSNLVLFGAESLRLDSVLDH